MDVAVLYPSFLLLIGAAYDPDWAIVLCRAFNRCVADEFVAKGEGRLHCVGVLPPQDPEEAAKELAHVRGRLFTRFSDLRVAFLEVGATWVPWYVDRSSSATPRFTRAPGRTGTTSTRARCGACTNAQT